MSSKTKKYQAVHAALESLLEGERDWVAAMATVACELHHAFDHYQWTGFYRAVGGELVLGPYQGGHGCLRIDRNRGVCGAAARSRETQRVADVEAVADHIACSSTTRSEIVVPLICEDGSLLAVLDVDSDTLDAFDEVDQEHLEQLCEDLASRFGKPATAVELKPEVERLRFMIGSFCGGERQGEQRSEGRITAEARLGGRVIVSDYVQRGDAESEFLGHGIYGYDPSTQRFTMTWFDSEGAGRPALASGRFEGDRLVFVSDRERTSRYLYEPRSDGYGFTIEVRVDDGWQPVLAADYRRV